MDRNRQKRRVQRKYLNRFLRDVRKRSIREAGDHRFHAYIGAINYAVELQQAEIRRLLLG